MTAAKVPLEGTLRQTREQSRRSSIEDAGAQF